MRSPVDAAVSMKLHLRSKVLYSLVVKGFVLAFPKELAKAKVCGANLFGRKYFSSSSVRKRKVLSVPSCPGKNLSTESKLEIALANSGGNATPGSEVVARKIPSSYWARQSPLFPNQMDPP